MRKYTEGGSEVVMIGAGRLATHLSRALRGAGHRVVQVYSRHPETARTLAEGRADVVTGTYEGSGSTTRTITLGFQPKAVLLFCAGGMTAYGGGAYIIYGGLALPGHPVVDYGHNNEVAVEIVSTGFRLHRDIYRNVNNDNVTYYYLALR